MSQFTDMKTEARSPSSFSASTQAPGALCKTHLLSPLPLDCTHPASCLPKPQTQKRDFSAPRPLHMLCWSHYLAQVHSPPHSLSYRTPPPPLLETPADQALALSRRSTDPEGHRRAARSTPEPLQPAPAAPPPGRGQDCHFGDKNSVCNNVPTASDNPPPPTPLPDQEASSSTTFHRERYSPGLAPGTFGLDTLDAPAVSGICLGEAEVIWPGPLPPEGAALRTILARRACPCLPFLLFLLPGSPETPQSHCPGKGSEEAPLGTKEASPVLGSQVGTPFSTAPRLLVPTDSGTSPPQPLCPARPRFKVLGVKSFPSPTPQHELTRSSTKARSHSIRKVQKPSAHPPPRPWLGAGAGWLLGRPDPGL